MKRIGLVVLLAAALVVLGSCDIFLGQDGRAFLTVTTVSPGTDYLTAATQSGLGLPSTWYENTNYQVNAGTWDYAYNICRVTYTAPNYYYYVNANSTSVSYSSDTLDDPYTVGANAFISYYYWLGSISISTNKGGLFAKGTDRYYTLVLGWYGASDTIVYENGHMMASTVTADDSAKKVIQFTGKFDTITLTFNKNQPFAKFIGNMSSPTVSPKQVKRAP